MQEVTAISVGLGLTFILFNVFYTLIDNGWLVDNKPFNCQFCISVWVAIGISGLTLSVLPLTIPFIYHIIDKIVKR